MRRLAKVSAIIVLLLLFGWVWLRRFGGQLEQQTTDASTGVRAEVRLNTLAAATDANEYFVKLYPGRLSFGDLVFQASTYGGHVHVAWRDGHHLVVTLQHQDQLTIHYKTQNCNGIQIEYVTE